MKHSIRSRGAAVILGLRVMPVLLKGSANALVNDPTILRTNRKFVPRIYVARRFAISPANLGVLTLSLGDALPVVRHPNAWQSAARRHTCG